MNAKSTTYPPLVKNVTVPITQEAAFHRFTEGIALWWPMKTHSVGEAKTELVTMEPRVGGRLFETLRNGDTSDWGKVTAWDPPERVAFTWHPGRQPDSAQTVEVRFRAKGGQTEIELIHHDWETFGDSAQEMRSNYSTGWDGVLELFAKV